MKINTRTFVFLFVLIAITTIVKVICAPQIDLSGFSAILAVALFAGFVEKDPAKVFLLPLVAVFASDVLIQVLYSINLFAFPGFYHGQWVNYLLIAALCAVGLLLRKGKMAGVFAAAIIGPTIFFLASNYVVWATQGTVLSYSKDFNGLMACYTAGIPFFRNSEISTVIFLPAFIALHQWIVKGKVSLQLAK